MTFEAFLQFITQQGIWCALFVWLFFDSKNAGRKREEKLMTCIQTQSSEMKEITATLNSINERLKNVENSLREM